MLTKSPPKPAHGDLGAIVAATRYGNAYDTDGSNNLKPSKIRIDLLQQQSVPYAVIIRPEFFVFDFDKDLTNEKARALHDELKSAEIPCFAVESGGRHENGNPKHHIWARLIEDDQRERFITKAKLEGAEVKRPGEKIRPPGSPHRNGGCSTLTWGATEAIVRATIPKTLHISDRDRIPLSEENRRMIRGYINRVCDQIPKKRDDPKQEDHSAGLLNLAQWCDLIGYGENTFNKKVQESELYRGQPPKKRTQAWARATSINNHRRRQICTWMKEIHASGMFKHNVWPTINAVAAYMLLWGDFYERHQNRAEINVRHLAEHASVSPTTISSHLAKLIKGGWLKIVDPSTRSKPTSRHSLQARVYELSVGENVTFLDKSTTVGGEGGGSLTCAEKLRFEYGSTDDELTAYKGRPGLRSTVATMRGANIQGIPPLTVSELSAAMGIGEHAVRKHLRELKKLGQIKRLKGGRYLLCENLGRVIVERNLIAASPEHQRDRHAQDRRRLRQAQAEVSAANKKDQPKRLEVVESPPTTPSLPGTTTPRLAVIEAREDPAATDAPGVIPLLAAVSLA
jgi:DNA-binding transcriptional ArsR family regulator